MSPADGEHVDLREETFAERADRFRRARETRCAMGFHDDPDHSGHCVSCGARLDPPDPEDDR